MKRHATGIFLVSQTMMKVKVQRRVEGVEFCLLQIGDCTRGFSCQQFETQRRGRVAILEYRRPTSGQLMVLPDSLVRAHQCHNSQHHERHMVSSVTSHCWCVNQIIISVRKFITCKDDK